MSQTIATHRSSEQTVDKSAIRPFSTAIFRRQNLPNCAPVSTRQGGLNEKLLQMHPKGYSSRRFRRWRAIGRQVMTGARSKQK